MPETRARTSPAAVRLALWNADGLLQKWDELEEFVIRYDVDVMLVCETHLRACDTPNIRNYTLYRRDRDGGRGGGTAIYIKRTIDHSEVDIQRCTNLEANEVVVSTSSMGPLHPVAAYNRPQCDLLPSDLDAVFASGQPVIVAGDLNAKHPAWHSLVTNAKGKALFAYAYNHGISVLGPEESTHFHYNGYRPDVLDIAVMRHVRLQSTIRSVNELTSDHNPVILELGNDTDDDGDGRLRRQVNWPAFTRHVEANIDPLPVITDIAELDDAVKQLTLQIQNALAATTLTRKLSLADPLGLPDWLKQLIWQKNRARLRWQRSRDPADQHPCELAQSP